jgi:hypothetical protein
MCMRGSVLATNCVSVIRHTCMLCLNMILYTQPKQQHVCKGDNRLYFLWPKFIQGVAEIVKHIKT